jgi:predicted MFS family arabinose efflux permease
LLHATEECVPPSLVAKVSENDVRAWRGILAGLCASLVGIGLARFAYGPLLPVLITEGWFTPSEAAYLGAANLAGYLAGALLPRWLPPRIPPARLLRGMMLLATASFVACAYPLSFAWFFIWRLASGLSGGALMVLAPTAVLASVPAARRGVAGGAVFTGVGLGIVASGTLIPLLLQHGLPATWLGLGLLALALTGLAWGGWPAHVPAPPAPAGSRLVRPGRAFRALVVAYGLTAVGLVPHMVFLVDFIARGLGQGLAAGAHQWVLFGLGAVFGPVLLGSLADRIGAAPALRLCLLFEAAAVALPAVSPGPVGLAMSSVAVGAFVPGVVPLVLARLHPLFPGDAERRAAWSTATTAFALGQAAAAYGLSFVFARHGGAQAGLFLAGAAALAAALVVDLLAGRAAKPKNA